MIRSDLALAALATAAVPGMRPVSVGAIRTGEDTPQHQSALIEDVTGRTWLIRSPLGAAAGAELERNDDLVRQLGRHLPFRVPAAAGYADLGPDGRAVVYPYVEGQALNLRHLPVGPGLASAVGRAIAAVHNMPRELYEEFAVPVFDADQVRTRKLAALDRAAETGHVPNGLLARWEQALDAVPMWRFATVATHGTLDGPSFLVVFSDDSDAASGRVVGLTGWERAEIADPAEDFARLVELANPRAVDSVFESYALARSQRPDGYLLHRARLASEMRLLHGLAAAVGSGDEAFVRRRSDELRKLDRLTTSDTSLVPRTALVVAAEPTSPTPEGGPSAGADDPSGAHIPSGGEAPPREDAPGQDPPATGDGSVADDIDATAPVPRLPDVPAGASGTTPGGAASPPDRPDAVADISHSDTDLRAGSTGDQDGPDDVDDEPAVVVEPPSDGLELEPVSAADVTAPIPTFRAVGGTGDDAVSVSLPDNGSTTEAEPGTTEESSEPDTSPTTQPEPDSPGEAAARSESDAPGTTRPADDTTDESTTERLRTLYGMPESDPEGPDLGR